MKLVLEQWLRAAVTLLRAVIKRLIDCHGGHITMEGRKGKDMAVRLHHLSGGLRTTQTPPGDGIN